MLKKCFSGSQNPRLNNYVYHVLIESGEGVFQIAAYDFEQNKENKKRLLECKKETYFSIHKIAKLIIFHEVRRTRSYS